MSPVEILYQYVCAAAEQAGLRLVEEPSELNQLHMRAKAIEAPVQGEQIQGKGHLAPRKTLFAGNAAIIIGSLAESLEPQISDYNLETFLARWRDYQRNCAVARSWLNDCRNDELVLFLTGPIGSSADAQWRSFSAQIERNDLVCRKQVWLPPAVTTQWKESVEIFLARTFFARPWAPDPNVSQSALDVLADFSVSLKSWQTVLDDQPMDRSEVDYDQLVAKLIEECKE